MMKIILLLLLLFANTLVFSQHPVEKYDVDSASVGHARVLKGELIKVTFDTFIRIYCNKRILFT